MFVSKVKSRRTPRGLARLDAAKCLSSSGLYVLLLVIAKKTK